MLQIERAFKRGKKKSDTDENCRQKRIVMNFPHIWFDLRHPPDRVKAAILGNELKPYFDRSGWFTQGSVARYIRWWAEVDGSLLGKLSYFRAKNLSIFRFRIELAPFGHGSRVSLLVQHGPFSAFLRFLLYAVGVCMCFVGVVISYIGDKAMERGLHKTVEYLHCHLKMWDEAA